MKSIIRPLVLASLLVTQVFAQEDAVPEDVPAMAPVEFRSPEEVDKILAPLALYPDALVALILPASTFPSDIVLAARYLDRVGNAAKPDDQPWDDSVRALAHYPAIIKWMDEKLSWTKELGETFLDQPAEVMTSIQRLRGQARLAGSLKDTPEQVVIVEDDNIRITPTRTEVIYVPRYDPDIVYLSHVGFYSGAFLSFGIGYPTGYWLGYDLDWRRRCILTVDFHERRRYWSSQHDWRRSYYPGRAGYVHNPHIRTWQPRSNHNLPPRHSSNYRPRADFGRPGVPGDGFRGQPTGPRPGSAQRPELRDHSSGQNADRRSPGSSQARSNINGENHSRREGVNSSRREIGPSSESSPGVRSSQARPPERGNLSPEQRRDNSRPPSASAGVPRQNYQSHPRNVGVPSRAPAPVSAPQVAQQRSAPPAHVRADPSPARVAAPAPSQDRSPPAREVSSAGGNEGGGRRNQQR